MYQIKRTQLIQTDLETCWDFFSSPNNLLEITPQKIDMKVLKCPLGKMYEGMMIEYRMKPLLNIPFHWVTEISIVKPMTFFVDEQRKGPYKIWHHEHHFKQVEGGVEMTDLVSYELSFGFLGRLIHTLVVRKKLEGVFEHRRMRVEHLFNHTLLTDSNR